MDGLAADAGSRDKLAEVGDGQREFVARQDVALGDVFL
jgi:hypothetical protein